MSRIGTALAAVLVCIVVAGCGSGEATRREAGNGRIATEYIASIGAPLGPYADSFVQIPPSWPPPQAQSATLQRVLDDTRFVASDLEAVVPPEADASDHAALIASIRSARVGARRMLSGLARADRAQYFEGATELAAAHSSFDDAVSAIATRHHANVTHVQIFTPTP